MGAFLGLPGEKVFRKDGKRMLELLFRDVNQGIFAFIGIMAAYGLTCVLLHFCGGMLPRDGGRDFAVDGKLPNYPAKLSKD